MKLLHVGCGGDRPGEPWVNLDNLRTQLAMGTPERANLDKELNYVEHDLMEGEFPFKDETFQGCLLQHVIEHFTCHDAIHVLRKCRCATKGPVVASVPDSGYFLKVHMEDTVERAVELFGEPIHDAGHSTFRSYALARHDHKQFLTHSSLACLFLEAGFQVPLPIDPDLPPPARLGDVGKVLWERFNRKRFSAFVVGMA